LDIGPGHGVFAHQAKKSGFDVETIELFKLVNGNQPLPAR
jgi:hypothetical protein